MTPETDALAAIADFEAFRVDRGWPTPNHMRRTADALDVFTPAKYGGVLRWFADLCDAAPTESGYSVVPTSRLAAAEAVVEEVAAWFAPEPNGDPSDLDWSLRAALAAYREASHE